MPSLAPRRAPTSQARVTSVDGWAFELEAARRALVEQLKTHGLDGFGLEDAPCGRPRGRRAGALPARDAEGRPRPRPRDRLSGRRRLPADRSDDDAESGGDRILQRDARRDRCWTRSIARSRRWAAGCCGRGCCARSCRIERIQDRLDAVEEFAFRTTERAKVRDTLQVCPRRRAAGRSRRTRHRRAARSRFAPPVARRGPARRSCCSTIFRRRSSAA